MLGDISPQTVRITQQAVVYPGRDHVTSLRVERFDGRTYKPVDMTAVTRVILSFPEADPVIVYDSSVQAVFTHLGSALTVDLSDYAMPASVLGCQIILYDAEHPAGQVLVDDIDAVVQFDFRNVSPVGGIPAPAVDYLTDAPIDGVTYARKDGVWVPVDALVSGVSSVNGQSGIVVLDADDVGADPAGTGASAAASAVAAHTAASDPHPQYLTGAEGDAAYDASGAATSAVAAHVAASDPHPQYTTQSEGDARYERGLTAGTNITIDRTNPAAPVISASGGGGGGGAVDSVNGQTGVVVLDTDDIAEGVSNLYFTNGRAAAAAPVQTVDGQAGAVSLSSSYAPLSHVGAGGAAHSNAVAAGAAGFMTGADKTKLDGIAAGATQNSSDAVLLARANHTGTQAASTISDFASASRAQTEAELVAGTNVTITPSGSGATRQLTIAAAGGGGSTNLSTTTSTTTLTVNSDTGTDAVLPAATPSVAGVLTAADKTKLDGIAAGAQVNVPTDLSLGTITATSIPLNSSTGADVTLPSATTSLAGLQSAADKTKLAGVAPGATANANTDSLTEGTTNLYFTEPRVRATPLTGLSTATTGAVAATDTVLEAFGKLEKTKAPLASPAFTGAPTAPTATAGSNTTQIATTEFVRTATSNLVAQTITNGVTTSAPSQDAVFDALTLKAPLASPTFTGAPAAPTAPTGTNTTQLATTAFVQSQKTTSATDTTSGRVWRTDDLVKTTSATDTTAGRVTKVGDFGIGDLLDLRSTIYSTGIPSDIFDVGTLFGLADGNTLGIPGLVTNNHGVLTVNSQWVDSSAIWATSRSFLYGQRMFLQGAASASAWQPWVEVTTSANSLGHGQTWQDVTGSRALGTTYTNTTGRPIYVEVATTFTTTGSLSISTGSVTIYGATAYAAGCIGAVGAIVPNGGTYSIGLFGGPITGTVWLELR